MVAVMYVLAVSVLLPDETLIVGIATINHGDLILLGHHGNGWCSDHSEICTSLHGYCAVKRGPQWSSSSVVVKLLWIFKRQQITAIM